MTRGSESTTRLKRSPEALWREGSFGVVVLAPRASEPVTLAGTGSALWHAFDRERTVAEAADLLAAEFGADAARVAQRRRTCAQHVAGVRCARGDVVTLPATLAGVAAFGLPGVRPPMRQVPAAGEWRALLTAATRERLTPLLAIAADEGALRLTDDQHREARRAHEQAMRLCVLLERALVEVSDELDAAGVEHRVLKGSAVAHLDFPDPAWRAFGDVDVLVRGSDYDRALGVLTAKGAHRRYHEVRPGFDRRFGKGACVVLTDGTQIDVHRTFVSGPFGLTVDLPELFETWTTFDVGGRDPAGARSRASLPARLLPRVARRRAGAARCAARRRAARAHTFDSTMTSSSRAPRAGTRKR